MKELRVVLAASGVDKAPLFAVAIALLACSWLWLGIFSWTAFVRFRVFMPGLGVRPRPPYAYARARSGATG
jgi:hypothetical protein